jgi:hypothetical protein
MLTLSLDFSTCGLPPSPNEERCVRDGYMVCWAEGEKMWGLAEFATLPEP